MKITQYKDDFISQTLTITHGSKIPVDIICNGFSMKETITSVLHKYNKEHNLHLLNIQIYEIAVDIKNEFALNMKLKQKEEIE